MATFMNFKNGQENHISNGSFDVSADLSKNGWRPNADPIQAEELLSDKPVYTYILRPNAARRGFSISFVQSNGMVKHDNFTLIDPIFGIWRNGQGSHVGKLEKVICDMMDCTPCDLKPL